MITKTIFYETLCVNCGHPRSSHYDGLNCGEEDCPKNCSEFIWPDTALPDTGLDVERLKRALIESDLIVRYTEYARLSPRMDPNETVEHTAALWASEVARTYARLTSSPTAEAESRSNISNPSHSDWHEKGPACEPLIPHYHRKADRIIVWSNR